MWVCDGGGGGVVWPGGVRKVRILGCFRTCASSNGLGAAGREESVVWSSERHLGAKFPRRTCLGGVCEQMRAMSSRDAEAMSLCRTRLLGKHVSYYCRM